MEIIDAFVDDAPVMYLAVKIFDHINHIQTVLHPCELS